MLQKFCLILLPLFIFCTACNRDRTISIKAAVIYKVGAAQPVARTKFYLLKEDLEVIRKSEKVPYLTPIVAQVVEDKAGIQEDAIKEFIVTTTTSDFEGKAKFSIVPPGNYYVAGYATTRSDNGYLVWSVKIDTEKNSETVLLDQNNAFDSSN